MEFCQEDIKQVYHKLFNEARERYNAKQKRKDRMVDNYYEKIRRGKQEKLFHEVIFQIGNKDDMNAKSEDGLLAKRILTEFMDEFQARNPNLYVFSAHLHMDEETPHLHIDFVPYITGSKRGLDTRVSLKSALAAEGFTGGTRGATELNQWIASEKQELATVMERYGVEWLQKGTHEKHLSVLEFEKKERVREVAELDSQKREISSVVAQLGEEVSVKKQELKNATTEKELAEEATQRAKEEGAVAQQEKEVLLASNQDLRMENARLESSKDRLRMDNHDLKQKQLQLQTDNEELEQRHEDLQYTNSKLKNVNVQLSADNHTLEQRNDSLKSDNHALRQKYNDLQQNNVQLEKQQMDNGYVEVWFTDGNMLRIKCEEVEAALRATEQSLAKLHKLLDNKPIEYVAMALSGEMQAYCDIEDDMVKGMFGTIVQGYLKKGYNRATAEMMAREFFRYES